MHPVSAQGPSLPILFAVLLVATPITGCLDGPLFYDHGRNGAWGKEFLSAKEYTKLIVELDYQNNAKPETSTVNALQKALDTYLNKPRGIDIRQAQDVSGGGGGTKYTFNDIRNLEDGARAHYKDGKTAVLYILFVDAGSSEDSNGGRVLGAAYSGSSVVMFKKNMRDASTNCGSPLGVGCPALAKVEEAVMIHELGHILGLVNNGIPMVNNHEDPEHPGHSNNPDSVMYWKVESNDIIDLFLTGGGIPNTFDAHDRADMKAAGGK